MADSSTLPVAEGGTPGKSSFPWMLAAFGVGGLIIVILLLRGSSGGPSGSTPTTSAQTSINAALGSIQEENLNLMGQLSGSTQQLSGEIGQVNQGVIANGQSIQQGTAAVLSGQQSIQNNINSSTQSVLWGQQSLQNAVQNSTVAIQAGQTGLQNNLDTYYQWLAGQSAGIETNMLTYFEWLSGNSGYTSGQIPAPGA